MKKLSLLIVCTLLISLAFLQQVQALSGEGTVELDKTEYYQNDIAIVWVNDTNVPGASSERYDTLTVRVKSSRDLTGITVDCTETGKNTNVYKGTFKFSTTASSQATSTIKVWSNSQIDVTYWDKQFGLSPGTQKNITASAFYRTIDASISLDNTEYWGKSLAVVTVSDWDMNIDPDAVDTVTVRVNYTTNVINVSLKETDKNTGIFKGNFTFDRTTNSDADDILKVVNGKNFTVKYTDYPNAAGGTSDRIIEATWFHSQTGTIRFLSTTYDLGVEATVEVTDPDENRDPYARNAFDIEIYNKNKTGKKITLRCDETGVNTGIFRGVFNTGDSRLELEDSNIIYAVYADEHNNTGKPQDVKTTMRITVTPPQISSLEITHANAKNVNQAVVNKTQWVNVTLNVQCARNISLAKLLVYEMNPYTSQKNFFRAHNMTTGQLWYYNFTSGFGSTGIYTFHLNITDVKGYYTNTTEAPYNTTYGISTNLTIDDALPVIESLFVNHAERGWVYESGWYWDSGKWKEQTEIDSTEWVNITANVTDDTFIQGVKLFILNNKTGEMLIERQMALDLNLPYREIWYYNFTSGVGLGEGYYVLHINVTDMGGRFSDTMEAPYNNTYGKKWNITIDNNLKPEIRDLSVNKTLYSPAQRTYLVKPNEAVHISAEIIDLTLTNASVEVYSGQQKISSHPMVHSTGNIYENRTNAPQNDGVYEIRIVAEDSKGNKNSSSVYLWVRAPKPDLTISKIDIPEVTRDRTAEIKIWIDNVGDLNATNFVTVISIDAGNKGVWKEVWRSTTALLGPHAGTTITFNWTATTSGNHTIKAVADVGYAVPEYTELNNTLTKRFKVHYATFGIAGMTKHLNDTNSDGKPDIYWDPYSDNESDVIETTVKGKTVYLFDTNWDGEADKEYNPETNEVLDYTPPAPKRFIPGFEFVLIASALLVAIITRHRKSFKGR